MGDGLRAVIERAREVVDDMGPLGLHLMSADDLAKLLDAAERGLAPREPDYLYDPEEWECTYEWSGRSEAAEGHEAEGLLWEPVEFATLIKGPPVWAKLVALTRDEHGDPDETEVRWFWSLEEAKDA